MRGTPLEWCRVQRRLFDLSMSTNHDVLAGAEPRDEGSAGTRPPPAKKRWLSIVALILVAAMVVPFVSRRGELANVRQLSITVLLLATSFQFLSQLMWNAATWLLLRSYAKDLGFWELYLV